MGRKKTYLPPKKSVGYQIRATHRAFNRILGVLLAEHDLTPAQWFFLRALWEKDGVSQRELSQTMGLTEPTTVAALRVMERRKLIFRRRDPNDRRRSGVFLSGKGRALRERLSDIPRRANEAGIRGETAEDIDALLTILIRIRNRVEAAVREATR